MTVYVDEAIDYGVRKGNAGPYWCHLTADSEDELRAFALRLFRSERAVRAWCSDRTQPRARPLHYDLDARPERPDHPSRFPSMRTRAMQLGAVFIPGVEQALRRYGKRVVNWCEHGDLLVMCEVCQSPRASQHCA